jgi:hypothetical protein
LTGFLEGISAHISRFKRQSRCDDKEMTKVGRNVEL